MSDRANVREGMRVYSGEGRELGTVERIDGDSVTVNGQQYEFTSIERVEGDQLYLTRQVGATAGMGTAGGARAASRVVEGQGEVRVPVHEERLDVDKRQAELGEVQVRKTVEQEQQTVPVELRREEVHVEQRDVADRPATETDTATAFQEGTIRVPVRGEEAVVSKEAVVTGEVVIDKEQTTERQEVTDTVRRERVEVDEDYERHRPAFQQHFAQGQQASSRRFEDVEPHYQRGYVAARDQRYAQRDWDDVEPHLRRDYEAQGRTGGDTWEQLRDAVREGWSRARGR